MWCQIHFKRTVENKVMASYHPPQSIVWIVMDLYFGVYIMWNNLHISDLWAWNLQIFDAYGWQFLPLQILWYATSAAWYPELTKYLANIHTVTQRINYWTSFHSIILLFATANSPLLHLGFIEILRSEFSSNMDIFPSWFLQIFVLFPPLSPIMAPIRHILDPLKLS